LPPLLNLGAAIRLKNFEISACRISIPAVLDAQPKLKMPTFDITAWSSLTDWFKDVARAVTRINLQASGWLLSCANHMTVFFRRFQKSAVLRSLHKEEITWLTSSESACN